MPVADEQDIEGHFSAQYTVPEPAAAAEALRDIDRLGEIGIASLKERGYFTRVVMPGEGPARRLLDPSRVRVLVVEDDDGTAALIEKTLHSGRLRTLRARNRLEIGRALAAKPLPHLVLLDVMLTDANGFDVLNRIRQHPALAALPVLMLTSLGERKDVARGLQLGASGYLTKPVLPSTLLQAVETLIGG